MKKMARIVDIQKIRDDNNYKPMAPSFDGIAFKAACDFAYSKGKRSAQWIHRTNSS